jgi:hypothetical protein
MDQANTASGLHGLHTGLFNIGPYTCADKHYALIRCRDFALKAVNAIERRGVMGSWAVSIFHGTGLDSGCV